MKMITETIKVLRYPQFQNLYGLTEADLLEYDFGSRLGAQVSWSSPERGPQKRYHLLLLIDGPLPQAGRH